MKVLLLHRVFSQTFELTVWLQYEIVCDQVAILSWLESDQEPTQLTCVTQRYITRSDWLEICPIVSKGILVCAPIVTTK